MKQIFLLFTLAAMFLCSSSAWGQSYHPGDFKILSDFLKTNGMTPREANIDKWTFVAWNKENPKRLISINLTQWIGKTGTINFSGVDSLTTLVCNNNAWKLELSGNPALKYLQCQNCQLTELDLSGNPHLISLGCSNQTNSFAGPKNQLTKLDLSNNPDLSILNCKGNPMTEVKLSDKTALTKLDDIAISSTDGGKAGVTQYDPSANLVTITATPEEGYAFKEWTTKYNNPLPFSNVTDATASFTFITGAVGAIANFVEQPLSTSPSSLDFAAAGETKTFAVNTKLAWTAESSESWLTITPTSGTGNETVTATAAANTTTTARTATVTLTAEGVDPITVTITQEAAALTLSTDASSLNFIAAGEAKTLAITSNTNWEAVSSESWLTVSPASGDNSETVTVTAAANTATTARTATVTISGTGVAPVTVTITQAAADATPTVPTDPTDKPTFAVSFSLNFSAAGEAKTFSVASSTGWKASGSEPWLTVSPATGNNSGTVTVTAAKNTATTSRTAIATISGGTGVALTVAITQAAGTANVAPAGYTITARSGNHGTITPDNTLSINRGAELKFTFRPDTGYEVDKVKIDGVVNPEAAAAGFYTFKGITANHTIEVTFRSVQTTATADVKTSALTVFANDGRLHVSGLTPGEEWTVYSTTGATVRTATATGTEATVILPAPGVYIFRTARETVKVIDN
ncbi:MAG: hypothetical protein LBV32_11615 [Tannerellaceae bacterium]|jgi:hypothetical protein|nr:hypothetical protein [Tannerellaceae bacterium]